MMKSGEVIKEYGPWLLVKDPEGKPRKNHVVVDRSAKPPVLVHGPTSKSDAEAYCRVNAQIWSATKGQTPG